VEVEARLILGVVLDGAGDPVDPVGVPVLVHAAGLVAAGHQLVQHGRLAGPRQSGDVEQRHRRTFS
jgi:hypothetical protein